MQYLLAFSPNNVRSGFPILLCFTFPNMAGKKRKDQHDPAHAGAALNPSYTGTYGATPPVSMLSLFRIILFHVNKIWGSTLSLPSFILWIMMSLNSFGKFLMD